MPGQRVERQVWNSGPKMTPCPSCLQPVCRCHPVAKALRTYGQGDGLQAADLIDDLTKRCEELNKMLPKQDKEIKELQSALTKCQGEKEVLEKRAADWFTHQIYTQAAFEDHDHLLDKIRGKGEMKVDGMQKTALPGVWTVWGERCEDERGLIREIWRGEQSPWKLTLLTTNIHGVLRGFHADTRRWRLLTCVAGEIRHVAMSAQGQWLRHSLDPRGPSLLWKPGIFSGYLVLSDTATVAYNVTEMYKPGEQITRAWNTLGVEPWLPMSFTPILSERDNNA